MNLRKSCRGRQSSIGSCGAGRTLSHRFGKIYKYRSGLEKTVDGNNDVVEALEMEGGQETGGGLGIKRGEKEID